MGIEHRLRHYILDSIYHNIHHTLANIILADEQRHLPNHLGIDHRAYFGAIFRPKHIKMQFGQDGKAIVKIDNPQQSGHIARRIAWHSSQTISTIIEYIASKTVFIMYGPQPIVGQMLEIDSWFSI